MAKNTKTAPKGSYAEQLKSRIRDDIPSPSVVPTGTYLVEINGKGRINDSRSDHERAPDALVAFSIRIVDVVDVQQSDLDEASNDQGYSSVEEFLKRWRGFAEFEVWAPREGDSDDEPIAQVRQKMARVFGRPEYRRAQLQTILDESDGIRMLANITCVDTSDGPRNYSVGSRALAPVDQD